MTRTKPAPDGYPWDQLQLIPPSDLTIEWTIHLSGPSERVQVGYRLLDGPDGDLLAMEVTGWQLDGPGIDSALRHITRLVHQARGRLSPF